MNQVDKIMAYEQGDLSEEDTIDLFQSLINSGLAWQLQGHYGRTAKALIDAGLCTDTNICDLCDKPYSSKCNNGDCS